MVKKAHAFAQIVDIVNAMWAFLLRLIRESQTLNKKAQTSVTLQAFLGSKIPGPRLLKEAVRCFACRSCTQCGFP